MTISPKIRIARRLLTWSIWSLVATGLLLRLTVRDRYFPAAMIYYMTPVPAAVIWMLIAGIIGSPPKTWKWKPEQDAPRSRFSPFHLNLVLSLFFAVWAYQTEYVDRAHSKSQDSLRVVFWNVGRLYGGIDRIATQLKTYQPQVIALVEAGKNFKLDLDEWKRVLPEYEIVRTDFEELVAVKGTASLSRTLYLRPGSTVNHFEMKIDDVEFTFLLVDVASSLKRSRRRSLTGLAEYAENLCAHPVLIAGDFNTPDDSVWFEDLREHYRQSFRESGSGYAPTWPTPLPVLTLDQIWVSESVDVSHCEIGWTTCSDHRPVVCDISIRKRP